MLSSTLLRATASPCSSNPFLDQPEGTPDVSQVYTQTNFSTAIQIGSFGTGTSLWDNIVVADSWEDLRIVEVTTLTDEDDGDLNPSTGAGTSLREAINHAPTGANIVFANDNLSRGTLFLTEGDLDLDRDLTIVGPGGGLTIDADNSSRIMSLSPDHVVSLSNLNLTGGRTTGSGGAIQNDESDLTLNGCTLFNNVAAFGGAIFNAGIGSGNSASLRLNNCTVTGNSATSNGGGILNNGRGGNAAVFLTSCTVTRNSAANNSGGFTSDGSGGGDATLTLENTIIAQNTAGNLGPDLREFTGGNGTATTAVVGNNIISSLVSRDSDTFPLSSFPSAIPVQDPLLAPLARYGGPTLTMHPLADSPAIRTTTSNRNDQRGFTPNTPLTIGAVQVGPVRDRHESMPSAGTDTLRQALNPAANFVDIPGCGYAL